MKVYLVALTPAQAEQIPPGGIWIELRHPAMGTPYTEDVGRRYLQPAWDALQCAVARRDDGVQDAVVRRMTPADIVRRAFRRFRAALNDDVSPHDGPVAPLITVAVPVTSRIATDVDGAMQRLARQCGGVKAWQPLQPVPTVSHDGISFAITHPPLSMRATLDSGMWRFTVAPGEEPT